MRKWRGLLWRATKQVHDGVVLLHGIGRTKRSMAKMERALRTAGFPTLNFGYSSRRKPLEPLADDLERAVTHFADGGPIHFVTHSMGGLVVRVLLARQRPPWLGRVVMLGPPNAGSEIADLLHQVWLYRAVFGQAGQQLTTGCLVTSGWLGPIDYPLGIIAGVKAFPILSRLLLPGPSDGKVTVKSTMLDGMTDHLVVAASHPWLMRNDEVISQTIEFLREGRFRRDERPGLAQRGKSITAR